MDIVLAIEWGYTISAGKKPYKKITVHHFFPVPYLGTIAQRNVEKKEQPEDKDMWLKYFYVCLKISPEAKALMNYAPNLKDVLNIKFSAILYQNNHNLKTNSNTENQVGPFLLCEKVSKSGNSNAKDIDIGTILLFKEKKSLGDINKLDNSYLKGISRNFFKEELEIMKETIMLFKKLNPQILENNADNWGNLNRAFQLDSSSDVSDFTGSETNTDLKDNLCFLFQENHNGFPFFALLVGLRLTWNMEKCFQKWLDDRFEQVRPLNLYIILNFKFLKHAILNGGLVKIPSDKLFFIVVGAVRTKLGLEFAINFPFLFQFCINYFKYNNTRWPSSDEKGMAYLKKCVLAIMISLVDLCFALQGIAPNLVIKINTYIELVVGFDVAMRCFSISLRFSTLSFKEQVVENHILSQQKGGVPSNFM